jgi:hypothetical protein
MIPIAKRCGHSVVRLGQVVRVALLALVGIACCAPRSSAPAAASAADATKAACTHDGGSCSFNSDCCSGDCNYSNGSKVCVPAMAKSQDSSPLK